MIYSACSTGDQSDITYWFEDTSGRIETNDIVRLQKEVPFTIVLPTYIPDELTIIPPGLYKSRGRYSPDDVWVNIFYSNPTTPNTINIDEVNSYMERVPSELTEYTYFNYGAIEVLEEKFLEYNPWSDEGTTWTVLAYTWDKDGINFQVDIRGYDQTEARKIIESMIQQ